MEAESVLKRLREGAEGLRDVGKLEEGVRNVLVRRWVQILELLEGLSGSLQIGSEWDGG